MCCGYDLCHHRCPQIWFLQCDLWLWKIGQTGDEPVSWCTHVRCTMDSWQWDLAVLNPIHPAKTITLTSKPSLLKLAVNEEKANRHCLFGYCHAVPGVLQLQKSADKHTQIDWDKTLTSLKSSSLRCCLRKSICLTATLRPVLRSTAVHTIPVEPSPIFKKLSSARRGSPGLTTDSIALRNYNTQCTTLD